MATAAGETVTLVLCLARREPAWTVVLAPSRVTERSARVFKDFRSMSEARGMAMTAAEIRHQCWAPMVAKLVGTMTSYGDREDTGTARFAELAMCFLAALGFGTPRGGDSITIAVAGDGVVTLRRQPHRLLRRARVTLGNWREATTAQTATPSRMT